MTANVAQVFLTDEEWAVMLRAVRSALRPGGRLAFESCDSAWRAWGGWNRDSTTTCARGGLRGRHSDGLGGSHQCAGTLVSFQETVVLVDGSVLSSESTLRFRTRAELLESVASAGLVVDEVRDAPDRPGRELVVIAHRPD
ncbi:hypothetical protein SAMN05661080_05060 [Modestobacter sp. DSM 44400]|uniref:hypothetical protein n=1 Tax=Modestobacter sp. DSM 44400 TaxID=1550230 RepID=UPI0008987D3B|nr:hypothetical protein [Modestobacter sp. DSM 44400]SDY93093.1 hypothetical protein SAMN05661080_05060 [Modestobacter sp. DSM 44400]